MHQLFYGPAGTGKTTALLQKYLELKKENIFRTDVFYLVPTAEHAERIKSLALAKINPLFADNIMTLDSFFYTDLDQKFSRKFISAAEQQLLLYKICQDLDLEYFASARHSPAFYSGLAELILELKDYCIDQKNFIEKLSDINPRKADDLQKILQSYADYLTKNNLQDKASALSAYQPPAQELHIFIDGFTDFTPLQYVQLGKLSKQHLYTALTYDERPFFAGQKTFQKFCDLGFVPQKMSDYQRGTAEDLSAFALRWGEKEQYAAQNIKIISAGNRGQEIEAIARQIVQHKLENPERRWSDFAIILRGIGGYQFLINEIFRQYQIPAEVHEGIAVLSNPFCGWLLSLYTAGTDNEALLALLKSAYAQTDKALVHQLEFLLAQNLNSALEELSPQLKPYIQNVLEKSSQLQAATKFSEIKTVLADFYSENNYADVLKKDSTDPALKSTVRYSNRAYDFLLETLDNLQEWQDKLDLSLIAQDLREIFITGLSEKTAARRRNGDQVQVYDALSARQKDYKIVFLADLTLESWPAGAAESFLVKDYEKEQLNLGFKRTADKIRNEDIIFYLTFTRASEQAYLCLAAREAGGRKLNPSPYLNILKKFYSGLPEIKYNQPAILADNPPLCREEYEQSVIYRFFNQTYVSPAVAARSAREKDLDYVLSVLQKKNDKDTLHLFDAAVKAELQKLTKFSVTQMEKYSRCAFRFFCEDVLRLRGKPEDKTILTIGSLMHKVLESYYQQAAPDLSALIEQVWGSEEFREKLKNILPAQAQVERKKITDILQNFIRNDNELCEARNFRPAQLEYKLQDEALHKGEVGTLSGVLDRIDKNPRGDFLIVDYKTSNISSIKPDELKKGILPQVLIYAYIYQELSGQTPAGAEYSSIKHLNRAGLYCTDFPELTNPKSKTKPVTAAEFAEILQKIKNKITEYFTAIQNGKFQTQNDEKCSEYCTAGEICRKAQTGARV